MDEIDGLVDVPIDPEEANDLKLHVRNCIKRHVVLVKLMTKQQVSMQRQAIITWTYRSITIPLLVGIFAVLWKVLERLPENPAALTGG